MTLHRRLRLPVAARLRGAGVEERLRAREHRAMEEERLAEILSEDFHQQFARVTEYR